jgi:hypothetical protein
MDGKHFTLLVFEAFSLAIVQRLYRLNPEAVMVQDYVNRLSLHQACQSAHTSLEFIKFLIENIQIMPSQEIYMVDYHFTVLQCTFPWT